ncbi:hypothetical protein [Glaciihabitans sp. dw_435]|uniref:hypothetical protein n=1 Tax=Glaciihabitans sp. dw_435 TaxID=2720081 RepID=UPI001BD3F9CC|nr:hypothetical protein [Glaciihabitans sp. dw_435]
MTTESQPGATGPNLGKDGTIPNSDDGIAVGHDPEKSNFNPEEDQQVDVDVDESDDDAGNPPIP